MEIFEKLEKGKSGLVGMAQVKESITSSSFQVQCFPLGIHISMYLENYAFKRKYGEKVTDDLHVNCLNICLV